MFRLAASPSIRPPQQMSVSEQQRKLKELLLGGGRPMPITGQYYDVIRASQQVRTSAPRALTNAAVRGINNKAGGVRSFAAANYNYPSGQMVIGASLAGFSASPSEDRKRQMARLMGLGAAPDPELAKQIRLIAGLLGVLQATGKLPLTFDVGDQVCDTQKALRAAANYAEKNGLALPFTVAEFAADITAVTDGVAGAIDMAKDDPIMALTYGGSAGAAGISLAQKVTQLAQVAAPLVGACKPRAAQAAPPDAPPPQPGPPRSVPPRLKYPGRGGVAVPVRTGPFIPVLKLPPKGPAIPGPTSSSAGNAGIIAAGVAAVGAAAYFLLRKKKSAA